jgi:hypothetical protein
MTKIRTLLAFSFLTYQLSATEIQISNKPEFVLAVFATHRSRAGLLDKANELNIASYIVNWQSKVDLKNNCIKNVWIRAGNQWFRLKKRPLPDVIYDFGVYKNSRKRKEKVNSLKEQLSNIGIPFINPEEAMGVVNNKLGFAQLMQNNQIAHPETKKYKKSNLKKMIAKHELLFIKPTLGSKGYGIIILEKINENIFSIKYKILNDKKQWMSISKTEITKKGIYSAIEEAKKSLKKTKTDYIIQEGINVFNYQNKQTDFRINIQRSQNGVLSVTGLMMRIGGNLSQGGRPADHNIILKFFEDNEIISTKNIAENVIQIAIRTHLAIENFTGKKIGDLGMDVVIDNNANPYIIEANTKSGYPSEYIKKNPDLENLYGLPPVLKLCEQNDLEHERNIIEYARYLKNNL